MSGQNFRVKNGIEVGSGVTITQTGLIATGIVTANSFRPSSGYIRNQMGRILFIFTVELET